MLTEEIVENVEKKGRTPWGAVSLFLSGAAIGALAGILLAPDSGKETRRRLGDWIKEKRQSGRESLAERKEQVQAAVEAGKKAYQEKTHDKKLIGV
ncbi:MAG: YtxH domain-containing protein [Elusimicrobia bacterium]|nr:YtxH domain-containing protein [Elusimicrobiota bacterium]